MIKDMISKLEEEGGKEAQQKQFCDKELAATNEKKDANTQRYDEYKTRQDKYQAFIAKTKEEIATGQKESVEITQSQAAMDEQRRAEKATYAEAKDDYEQGVDGVQRALKVLRD